jgi:hypothetical protein
MGNLKMVFRGTHAFTFNLPQTAEMEEENYQVIDVPGFEAVCEFRHLDELQATDEPAFTHAQAIAVADVEDWDFRGGEFASVLALPEAVRWILCFPVVYDGVRYALETSEISPDGDDVFFYFTGTVSFGTPIRAVPSLDDLKFLSPLPQSKLALVRAKDWRWDGEAVLIAPQDVLELEIVLDSEVRVF